MRFVTRCEALCLFRAYQWSSTFFCHLPCIAHLTPSIYNQNSQTRHEENSVLTAGWVYNLPHHDIMSPSMDGFTVRVCLCTVFEEELGKLPGLFQFSVVLLRPWLVAKGALSSGSKRTNKRLTTGMRNIEQILASVSTAVASIGLCTQLCWSLCKHAYKSYENLGERCLFSHPRLRFNCPAPLLFCD